MIANPLDERVGHIAGVGSVAVDGRRWYCGSDPVVSPFLQGGNEIPPIELGVDASG